MILRLLNAQGIAGLAVSVGLAVLLVIQKSENRHCRKQSAQFEQLYHAGERAFARTVADYRAAVAAARDADRAAADRIKAQQASINERTVYDYETRLAAARARARQLQLAAAPSAADRSGRGTTALPSISIAAGGPHQAAGEDGLPATDALIATEQAIQLDELIKWVRAQSSLDPNAVSIGGASRSHR